ncbi:MAG: hypothetical protein LBV09_03690, partial [Deferribacteraceae bacterium]|nr:hypothetical protein [Deferribacteraceae bacterium]
MKKNILAENEALRLNLGWFLLFCIALPQPINLGIEDFLALPADANTYLVQIFATVQDIKFFVVYIVAILLAIFVPRYIVQLGRILI